MRGKLGRMPHIDKDDGREHWPRVTIPDLNGTPQYFVEPGIAPLRELI